MAPMLFKQTFGPKAFRHLFVFGQRCSFSSWTSKKSPYEILGLNRSASDKEIKTAYFKKARQYHPDTNKSPDAANKFKEVSAAYEILSDKSKKDHFDNFGSSPPPGSRSSGSAAGGRSRTYQYNSNINPEEIFKEFFKSSGFGSSFFDSGASEGSQSQSRKHFYQNQERYYEAPVYQCQMSVSFLDAVKGASKDYHLNVEACCPKCSGRGIDLKAKVSRCPDCHGSGYISQRFGGAMVVKSLCGMCYGKGHTANEPCGRCNGKGSVSKLATAKVHIPPGVQDGQVLRTVVEGCEVLFQINVGSHASFWREGKDIHSHLDVTYPQACFGGQFRVSHSHGADYIKVPAHSSSGSKVTLSGMGVQSNQAFSRAGDHVFHIRIKIPPNLTERQRALVMALAEEEINRNNNSSNSANESSRSDASASKNSSSSRNTINGMIRSTIGWVFNTKPGDMLARIRDALNLKLITEFEPSAKQQQQKHHQQQQQQCKNEQQVKS